MRQIFVILATAVITATVTGQHDGDKFQFYASWRGCACLYPR